MLARMVAVFPFDFRMRALTGDLGRAIASVWFARGTIPYRREKVAPTGSTVAVMVLGDPIVETAGAPRSQPIRAETGFLIGPHDRPVTNEPTGETFAIGIVTTPVGAEAALGVQPRLVAGQVVDLAAAWPLAHELRGSALALAGDPDSMLDGIEAALQDGLRLDIPGLGRAELAVAALGADPTRPIAEIAADLGVTHGHLDREFTRIVGLSPRRLARLLRVERLLAALEVDAAVPWAELAADLGWTDQSHLIRDFRRHTGTTPTAYLVARRAFVTATPSAEAARFVPEPM
jgi:AraC-like DNA-binding protein